MSKPSRQKKRKGRKVEGYHHSFFLLLLWNKEGAKKERCPMIGGKPGLNTFMEHIFAGFRWLVIPI